MLPDFFVEIPSPSARIRCADVPAAVFFRGFTDDVPFTDCWHRAEWNEQHALAVGLQHWITGMLARVVVEPNLTPELVNRLGASRDVLARGYFETVGWIPRNPDADPAEVPTVTPAPASRKKRPVDFAVLTDLPGRNLKGILQRMSTRTRTLPATLWMLPTSEFLFNLRMVADPQPDASDAARALGLDV